MQQISATPGEEPRSFPLSGWLWWAFIGWWVFVALLFSTTGYYRRLMDDRPADWLELFRTSALSQAIFALMALVAFALAWRLPLDKGRWKRNLAIHLAVAGAVLFGRALIYHTLAFWVDWLPVLPLMTRLQGGAPANLLVYAHWVGIGYAFAYHRQFRERELRAAQLEAGLVRAQFQSLTTRIQPQFLFSTLRRISELMHRDVDAADRLLARLGDLLRLMLQQCDSENATLREELDFLETYLEIERARLDGRLEVEYDIHPDTLDAIVPYRLLQPVVEQLLPRAEGAARVRISSQRTNGFVELQVGGEVEGARRAAAGNGAGESVLAGTRLRLQQLYGGGHHVQDGRRASGERVVVLTIPFQPAAGGAFAEVP